MFWTKKKAVSEDEALIVALQSAMLFHSRDKEGGLDEIDLEKILDYHFSFHKIKPLEDDRRRIRLAAIGILSNPSFLDDLILAFRASPNGELPAGTKERCLAIISEVVQGSQRRLK